MDKSSVDKVIYVLLAIAVVFGVWTGYYFNAGDNTMIFVPMIIGIAVVFVLFHFVALREKILYGEIEE